MKKYLIHTIEKYIAKWAGKIAKQGFFERLHGIAVRGMNFGNGVSIEESGELFVIKYIRDYYAEKNDLIVFDVGGNVGNYSKKLSEYFLTPSIIYAFEPSKNTFQLFLNRTRGIRNIRAYNFGISDKNETKELFTNEIASGLASVYKRDLQHFGVEMNHHETIHLKTLDAFCSQQKIDHIHFLKLDIEGHELSALKGASALLTAGKIDFIQFEFGGCNIDSRTFFKDFYNLLNPNYRLSRIVTDGLYEIKEYKETDEIFTTINFLAKRRGC